MHQFFARPRTLFNCILACLVLTPVLIHPAWAALPPIYDVELIIFINKYPNDDGERWDTPDPDTIRPSGSFPEDHFTELATEFYTIENISYALERSGRHSVLFHRAWRQLAYDKAHAVAYPIHSIAENGRDSVEGIIKLVRERFLHLDVDVQLMSAARGREVLYSDSPDNQPAFELIETRRIKSNVLHYFDHPRFGMIAKVTPYIPPEADITDEEEEQQETPVTEETGVDEPKLPDDQLTR
jgi:hypothetical protein